MVSQDHNTGRHAGQGRGESEWSIRWPPPYSPKRSAMSSSAARITCARHRAERRKAHEHQLRCSVPLLRWREQGESSHPQGQPPNVSAPRLQGMAQPGSSHPLPEQFRRQGKGIAIEPPHWGIHGIVPSVRHSAPIIMAGSSGCLDLNPHRTIRLPMFPVAHRALVRLGIQEIGVEAGGQFREQGAGNGVVDVHTVTGMTPDAER